MALSFRHAFTSAKVDGGDTTLLQPSHWNAEHVISLAADKIIGRDSSGSGVAQELDCTALARAILAAADQNALKDVLGIFSTGDAKLTLKHVADAGWVMMDDGTIGTVGSGANHTGDDYQSLFVDVLWAISDTWAPLYTSSGVLTTRAAQGSAATAWAAGCRLALTKVLGRSLTIGGAGAGLTSRTLGSTFGAEQMTLTKANLPNVQFDVNIPAGEGNHSHQYWKSSDQNKQDWVYGGSSPNGMNNAGGSWVNTVSNGLPEMHGTAASGGSDTAFDLSQPSSAWNIMIKL